jgi:hypothetical protein
MIKIAVSGKAKSGKGLLSKLFKKHFPYRLEKFGPKKLECGGTAILAFADPIKEIVGIMFPEANYECLYGASELREKIIDPKYKDKNGNVLTHRQALIDIGKLGRSYDKDFWLNKTKNIIENECLHPLHADLLIINDIRFINEFEALKKDNFYTIRIKRTESAKIDDISETQQEEIPDSAFDCVIENNSSIEALESTVLSIINKIA